MLYLASRSPRRRQLLAQLGVPFEVLDVLVPEVPAVTESATDYVRRVARDKARAASHGLESGAAVLSADTEVILDGVALGKPRDAADATRMLAALAGRSHHVFTAVWLVDATGEHGTEQQSEVTFAPLDAAAIAAYIVTGEPFGKAGAYAIQGRAAGFISHLSGSYSCVMGLPLHETATLLAAHGLL